MRVKWIWFWIGSGLKLSCKCGYILPENTLWNENYNEFIWYTHRPHPPLIGSPFLQKETPFASSCVGACSQAYISSMIMYISHFNPLPISELQNVNESCTRITVLAKPINQICRLGGALAQTKSRLILCSNCINLLLTEVSHYLPRNLYAWWDCDEEYSM